MTYWHHVTVVKGQFNALPKGIRVASYSWELGKFVAFEMMWSAMSSSKMQLKWHAPSSVKFLSFEMQISILTLAFQMTNLATSWHLAPTVGCMRNLATAIGFEMTGKWQVLDCRMRLYRLSTNWAFYSVTNYQMLREKAPEFAKCLVGTWRVIGKFLHAI